LKRFFYNHQLVDYSWIAGSINLVVAVAITLQAESIQVSSDYNCRTGMVRGMDGRKNHCRYIGGISIESLEIDL